MRLLSTALVLVFGFTGCSGPSHEPPPSAGTAPAESGITQHERDYALSALHATRKLFLDSIDGVSEAQWDFKPGPGRWSIAEVAEHLTKAETLLFDSAKKLLESEPQKPVNGEAEDEKLMATMRDRTRKAEAPPQTRPTREWPTEAAAAAEFKARRDRTIQFIRETKIPLRRYYAAADSGPVTDAYQYFLMIAAHTERHVAQIDEIKADPKYPRR